MYGCHGHGSGRSHYEESDGYTRDCFGNILIDYLSGYPIGDEACAVLGYGRTSSSPPPRERTPTPPPAAAAAAAHEPELAAVEPGRIAERVSIDELGLEGGVALGSGGFSTVYKLRWRDKDVAVKDFRLYGVSTDSLERETVMMSDISHANVVQLLAFCSSDSPLRYRLALEYMSGGTLFKRVQERESPRLSRYARYTFAYRIGREVAGGLAYLHAHMPVILHLDLSSKNVLLDERSQAKISDFGLSRYMGQISTTMDPASKAGTMAWMSPERIDPDEDDERSRTTAADIYSLGIILWELASGKEPLSSLGTSIVRKLAFILAGQREPIPAHAPRSYAQLIEKCWAQRATDRPSAAEVVEELSSGFDADEPEYGLMASRK